MSQLTPQAQRHLYRLGNGFMSSCYGLCPGYLQANIAMMPSHVADQFEEFCNKNAAPCPLIYKSKVGDVTAPLLAKELDIRTDLPAYRIYKDGELIETAPDLRKFSWESMVSFYLGCSFSFDDKLLEAGIKLDQSKNVAMYLTNIDCIPVPPFSTRMAVSMRSIPRTQLDLAIKCTIQSDYAHGAPIQIGSPQGIGIMDIVKDEVMGTVPKINEGEIPVFWACGITSSYAVKSGNLPESFSHSPGSMFIADIQSNDVSKFINTKQYPTPVVVPLDECKQRFTIVSEDALKSLRNIEHEMMEDLGDRGIKELLVPDDYAKACLSLARDGDSIGIILGFPCFEDQDPLEENDGVAGAIYIAKALSRLGKQVTFIIDDHSHALKRLLESSVSVCKVTSIGKEYIKDRQDFLFDSVTSDAKFSHLVAIERPSPSIDGHYHRMSGKKITICEPTHHLFEQASASGKITTIGIGDGGNELGMGKVHDNVVKFVTHGQEIASVVSCDYLITCGVSNWGGFGVAVGLHVLSQCAVFDRYRRYGIGLSKNIAMDEIVFSKAEDERLNIDIAEKGFRDGCNQQAGMTIDNLDYYKVHVKKFEIIRKIAKSLIAT